MAVAPLATAAIDKCIEPSQQCAQGSGGVSATNSLSHELHHHNHHNESKSHCHGFRFATATVSPRVSTLGSLLAIAVALSQHQQTWRANAAQMAWSLLLVLRNACVSVAFAGLAMFCFSRGNVFSAQAAVAQSSREFDLSLLLWWKLVNWIGIAATDSVSLMSQRFASKPDTKPTFFACWFKVVRGTYRLVIATTVITFGVSIALLQVPTSVQKLRIHVYVNAFWFHFDTCACNMEATRIFNAETVRGQEKRRANAQRRLPPYWTRLVRLYAVTIVTMTSFGVTALYTHTTATLELMSSSQILLFTLGSFALKIALQEVTKLSLLRKSWSAGVMAALVGIPTILIDTQMRIVVLRAKTTSATLSGTLVMAFIEISTRCFKSLYVKHQIKRKGAQRAALASIQATPEQPDSTRAESSSATPQPPADTQVDFDQWRLRLLTYHAAEVYVDMFAEYVALGCSYVILFFCWNHPKYLLRQFDVAPESSSAAVDTSPTLSYLLGSSQATIMAWQLGVEIVVDYASCLLEIGNGIDFRPLQRQSFYLGLWLIWAASTNVAISANLFVRIEET